ncbi:unnamed protein product [Linum trigynum]|uniref:Uncharacterized protein n=1 Tax=Linum trigynum TaxID=586398 RepID=A0AAV2D722_9ROSI
MAVTTHYIDNSWSLRSHMLRFIYVSAPHSSDRLASVLVNCMLDWNTDSKSEDWCWRSVPAEEWSWVVVAAFLKDDTAGEEGSNELQKTVAAGVLLFAFDLLLFTNLVVIGIGC